MNNTRTLIGGAFVIGAGATISPNEDIDIEIDKAHRNKGMADDTLIPGTEASKLFPDKGIHVDANGQIFYNDVSLVQLVTIGSTALTVTFLFVQFILSIIKFKKDMVKPKKPNRRRRR